MEAFPQPRARAGRRRDLGKQRLGVPSWERQPRRRAGKGPVLGEGREISIKPEMNLKF